MILARDNSNVRRKTRLDDMEGPWMITRNGRYVLFTAAPYRQKEDPIPFNKEGSVRPFNPSTETITVRKSPPRNP